MRSEGKRVDLQRLAELKHVYYPQDNQRAIFKAAAQHYLDFRDQLTRLKHEIKAIYRRWGIVNVFTSSVYSLAGRDKYLKQLKYRAIFNQLKRPHHLMGQTEAMRKSASNTMKQLGRKYHEIREFKKYRVSPISTHMSLMPSSKFRIALLKETNCSNIAVYPLQIAAAMENRWALNAWIHPVSVNLKP